MNLRTIRIGLRRGWAEHTHLLKDRKELFGSMIGTVGGFVLMILWAGDTPLEGTGVNVATFMTAGFLAFAVFGACLMTFPMALAADREEGTLLRLRGLPGGIPAYLVGRATTLLCQIAVQSVLILATGLIVGGVAPPRDWPTLIWVLLLGAVAVVPLGAAIGSLLPNPKTAAGILVFPMLGLMIMSGVIVPVTRLPEIVGTIAQVFPLYWQGLGLRSALLPDSMLAAEIGHSWRLPQVAGVLAAWGVAGMLIAPSLIRRVTRRESGSRLAERHLAAKR
ncbi:ABC transporter permease [Microbispora rosea]|uniref:ABC transporter permease n=1 Tax=Microbispora rosea TaxID=58117 RepID=UPI003430D836